MARRSTLGIIGLVFFIVGSIAAYLLLTVPNDVRAEQLLRESRNHIQKKETGEARKKLQTIVLQYPRTDAAAAASSALFRIEAEEHERLTRESTQLRTEVKKLSTERTAIDSRVKTLETRVAELSKKPPPPPPVVKKPAPVKKKTTKKAPVKKKTTRRRR